MLRFVLLFLTAFLIGSFPTAYLVSRYAKGIDIRQHGSGNVGATNVFRVMGKKYGFFVFGIDFLKGAVAIFLTWLLWPDSAAHSVLDVWIGLGSILGHVFSPFLRFKGGKGVATGAGVLLATFPIIFIYTLLTWVIIFALTRTVSISSIIAVFSTPLFAYLMKLDREAIFFFLLVALLFIWTHRSNIYRLFKGKENKLVK